MSERTTHRARTMWLRAAQVAAAVAVAYFLGRYLVDNWAKVSDAELDFDPGLLVLSVVVLAAYFAGRVLVWNFLTVRNDIAVALPDTFAAWMYSQLGKYLPGKVFLLLGRVYMYGRRGKSKAMVTITFAIETVATLAASVLVLLLALVFVDLGGLAPWRPVLVISLVGFAIALHPRILGWGFNLLLRLLRKPPIELPLTYRDALAFVGLYILNWLLFGVAFFFLVSSFADVEAGYMLYLAGSFSLATLVGMLSVFVPSGLGVREGVLIFMLQQIMPVEIAIIAAVVSRLWFTLVESGCIGVTWLVTRTRIPHREELEALRGQSAEPAVELRGAE